MNFIRYYSACISIFWSYIIFDIATKIWCVRVCLLNELGICISEFETVVTSSVFYVTEKAGTFEFVDIPIMGLTSLLYIYSSVLRFWIHKYFFRTRVRIRRPINYGYIRIWTLTANFTTIEKNMLSKRNSTVA
jgi:hypothetical protein